MKMELSLEKVNEDLKKLFPDFCFILKQKSFWNGAHINVHFSSDDLSWRRVYVVCKDQYIEVSPSGLNEIDFAMAKKIVAGLRDNNHKAMFKDAPTMFSH